jgi:predicted nucleic acid-binding Zn ribbon protein
MSHHRRSPRPLERSFSALAQRLAPDTLLAEAQGAWREAVGPSISERAWPVSERAGVLTVSCESSVWAQELDLMSDAILERVNDRLARGHIVKLRCVATPAGGFASSAPKTW